MKRDARPLVAPAVTAVALAACLALGGCATNGEQQEQAGGIEVASIPVAQAAEVLRAMAKKERLRGVFLLEHPTVSRSPTGGYKVRVASVRRGVSLVLPPELDAKLAAIWNGHDAQRQSVWVAVDGVVEPMVIHSGKDGFDDFSAQLYQRRPSRDPWGTFGNARLLGWSYGSKHAFREVEPGGGKGT